jgi:hypothetical protein
MPRTDAEWLACNDPERMLEFLQEKASDRKMRLFGVACCRRIWHLLIDTRSKNAVLVVERDADQSRPEEVADAFHESENAFRACEYTTDRHADAAGAARRLAEPCEDMLEKAIRVSLGAANAAGYREDSSYSATREDVEAECHHQCHLLRCIFGNSFRPVALDRSWLTPGVVTLAQSIYENRSFDRMPMLADALENSGCDDAEILSHCRTQREHTRGCWVIDNLLGKS